MTTTNSHDYVLSSFSSGSNFTFCNGIRDIGIPSDVNPPIFITIEITYKIDSGNTNEYQLTNSPNPNKPKPTATKSVDFFLPCKYDNMVSIEPYTSKMNDTARITCSTEANDTKNNGNAPTERRYFDLGKKVLIV